MISSTEAFQAAIDESSRRFNARLLDSGIEITGDIREVIVHKGNSSSTGLSPGIVFCPYIECLIDNCVSPLENKELALQIGVMTGEENGIPVYDYITLGFFTVEKPKTNAYRTTFTAQGRISRLTAPFGSSSQNLTLGQIINQINHDSGILIVVDEDIDTSFTLGTDLSSFSGREALSTVCSVIGGFATETSDGRIRICKFKSSPTYSCDTDRMTSLPEFNDYDTAINGVQVTDLDGNEYTAGLSVSLSASIPYMTQAAFEAFAENLIGLTYRAGDIPLALGDPRIEPWDTISVTDINGNTYNVPCMNITHVFDGGLQTNITALSLSDENQVRTDKEITIDTIRKKALENSEKIDDINAEFENLNTVYAEINFANIDFADIDIAKIGELFSEAGIISNLTTQTGTITGELVGVTIKGDLIEGNTIKADKLVIRGSDGLFYKLNTDGMSTESQQTQYNALDGSKIIAQSITASKISVSDLVAFGATIGGLRIENGSIHSNGKNSINSSASGMYMDSSGQFVTGDNRNFIASWYDAVAQEWKIALRADDISFGTGESVRDVITNAAAMVYDHSYVLSIENNVEYATFTAYLYEGKNDVKTRYQPSNFLWYKKAENNNPLNVNDEGLELLGTGYTIKINVAQIGYRGTIVGKFSSRTDTPLTDEDGEVIETSDGDIITGRVDATGYVKVSELPLKTPILSDKLMGIGSEEEYQLTIQALKDLIGGAMSYNELSDKPKIEGVALQGDKTYEELNLEPITNFDLEFMLT